MSEKSLWLLVVPGIYCLLSILRYYRTDYSQVESDEIPPSTNDPRTSPVRETDDARQGS